MRRLHKFIREHTRGHIQQFNGGIVFATPYSIIVLDTPEVDGHYRMYGNIVYDCDEGVFVSETQILASDCSIHIDFTHKKVYLCRGKNRYACKNVNDLYDFTREIAVRRHKTTKLRCALM